ncbi:MAG TPA: 5-oxoprolinase subunit PxpB [Pararobbsia sp.]|nr:5-oxoprolinase subunit PxpB [Pararobbsia sp.]
MTSFEIFELGDHALVATAVGAVSFETQQRIWQIGDLALGWPEVDEAIPGMNNITLAFDPLATDLDALRAKLERACMPLDTEPSGDPVSTSSTNDTAVQAFDSTHTSIAAAAHREPLPARGRLVELPVHYGGIDGPDIEAVAQHAGLSVEALIERHAAAEYTVYFLGFQPGFAYLGGLDPALVTPRRKEPRLRVPAGSVGIGGEQTGVYPTVSPGGWQLIGRTTAVLFDPGRDPPSLLEPGDRVRFVPIGGTP